MLWRPAAVQGWWRGLSAQAARQLSGSRAGRTPMRREPQAQETGPGSLQARGAWDPPWRPWSRPFFRLQTPTGQQAHKTDPSPWIAQTTYLGQTVLVPELRTEERLLGTQGAAWGPALGAQTVAFTLPDPSPARRGGISSEGQGVLLFPVYKPTGWAPPTSAKRKSCAGQGLAGSDPVRAPESKFNLIPLLVTEPETRL